MSTGTLSSIGWGKPIAAINLGRTRADDLLAVKVEAPCEELLPRLAETTGTRPGGQA